MSGRLRFLPCLLLAGSFLVLGAFAQHAGPPGSSGASGGGMPGGHAMSSGSGGDTAGMGTGFPRNHGEPSPGGAPASAGGASTARGGLQFGPPGRWWDDKHFAKDLRLRSDQQRRMDAIFETNRGLLQKRLQGLEQEQNRMGSLTRTRVWDEGALFAEIDRIAGARAELEKANTHYLLQIRGEMDTEQITRLEQHR